MKSLLVDCDNINWKSKGGWTSGKMKQVSLVLDTGSETCFIVACATAVVASEQWAIIKGNEHDSQ